MSNHEPTLLESDNPNMVLITAAVVACIVVVAILSIAVTQYFGFAFRDHYATQVYKPENVQLREQRAVDQQRLNRYQWVDRSQDVVRLPVERAQELVLREWDARPAGLVGAGHEEGEADAAPQSDEATEPVEAEEATP